MNVFHRLRRSNNVLEAKHRPRVVEELPSLLVPYSILDCCTDMPYRWMKQLPVIGEFENVRSFVNLICDHRRMSHESLQASGSQGSMALDLHLECPVTLRVRDRQRNPLKRQERVDEDERQNDISRRSSHSCSPRLPSRHPRDLTTFPVSTGKKSSDPQVLQTSTHLKLSRWWICPSIAYTIFPLLHYYTKFTSRSSQFQCLRLYPSYASKTSRMFT
jgi:hypothetical protein